ncbi:MAG TPA: OmpH family outer membrane protein [Spirochaetota bacterium]|nr:OmpH family outer membrane protein [Spirochaetota bacterium]
MISRFTPFLAAALIAANAGCSSEPKRVEPRDLRVRAVNLSLIFDFLAAKNADAKDLRERRAKLAADDAAISSQRADEGDPKKRAELDARLKKNEGELKELGKREESVKARLYAEINRSVAIVAKRMDLDYILTVGDALVYSKKEHDITDEVIREIVRLHNRNAPVSR